MRTPLPAQVCSARHCWRVTAQTGGRQGRGLGRGSPAPGTKPAPCISLGEKGAPGAAASPGESLLYVFLTLGFLSWDPCEGGADRRRQKGPGAQGGPGGRARLSRPPAHPGGQTDLGSPRAHPAALATVMTCLNSGEGHRVREWPEAPTELGAGRREDSADGVGFGVQTVGGPGGGASVERIGQRERPLCLLPRRESAEVPERRVTSHPAQGWCGTTSQITVASAPSPGSTPQARAPLRCFSGARNRQDLTDGYAISPPDCQPLTALCDMDVGGGGRTVSAARKPGHRRLGPRAQTVDRGMARDHVLAPPSGRSARLRVGIPRVCGARGAARARGRCPWWPAGGGGAAAGGAAAGACGRLCTPCATFSATRPPR